MRDAVRRQRARDLGLPRVVIKNRALDLFKHNYQSHFLHALISNLDTCSRRAFDGLASTLKSLWTAFCRFHFLAEPEHKSSIIRISPLHVNSPGCSSTTSCVSPFP